jgi:hypothetical protein
MMAINVMAVYAVFGLLALDILLAVFFRSCLWSGVQARNRSWGRVSSAQSGYVIKYIINYYDIRLKG